MKRTEKNLVVSLLFPTAPFSFEGLEMKRERLSSDAP